MYINSYLGNMLDTLFVSQSYLIKSCVPFISGSFSGSLVLYQQWPILWRLWQHEPVTVEDAQQHLRQAEYERWMIDALAGDKDMNYCFKVLLREDELYFGQKQDLTDGISIYPKVYRTQGTGYSTVALCQGSHQP